MNTTTSTTTTSTTTSTTTTLPSTPLPPQLIDEEVRKMVQVAYERTKQLVEEKKDLIHIMAERLLAKEVLNLEDVELLFGPRPFATKNRTNIDRYRGISQEMRELENNKLLSPTGAISAEKKKGPPSQEGEGEGEGQGQGQGGGGLPEAPAV